MSLNDCFVYFDIDIYIHIFIYSRRESQFYFSIMYLYNNENNYYPLDDLIKMASLPEFKSITLIKESLSKKILKS